MKQKIVQMLVLSGLVISTSSVVVWAKEVEPKVKGSLSARGIRQADYPKMARINASEASRIATAQMGGSVISVGLENEDGFLIYAVEVAGTRTGRHEILVDAGDGKILASMQKTGAKTHDGDGEEEDSEQDDD